MMADEEEPRKNPNHLKINHHHDENVLESEEVPEDFWEEAFVADKEPLHKKRDDDTSLYFIKMIIDEYN